MAPTPLPETADPVPALILTPALASGIIKPSVVDQYLGNNIAIINSNSGGFQTTLPITTSNLMFSKGIRIIQGSMYKYFDADNFKIDQNGTITSSSVGTNVLAGALSLGGTLAVTGTSTLATVNTGAISSSANVTAVGNFSTTSGNFTTTTGKVKAQNLEITSTNLKIDSTSATNNITLTGSLDVKNLADTFALNSTNGLIKTFGNISTSGSGTITAASALSGAQLNVGYYTGGKKALTIDGDGAITGKDVSDATIYSVGSEGNAFFKGTLQANGDVKFGATQQVTIAAASGNFVTPGSISSANITSSGNATISGNVSIGSSSTPAIVLSNSTTSTFLHGISVGDKHTFSSDGTVSLAAGNFAVAVTGGLTTKSSASFADGVHALNADGSVSLNTGSFTIGKDTGDVTATGKMNLTSDFKVATDKFVVAATSGNVSAAGTMSVENDLKVATDKFIVTATSGNVTAAGTMSVAKDLAVATNKFVVAATSGNVAAAGTMSVASDLKVATNKFVVTAASGNVAATGNLVINTDKFVVAAPTGNVTAKGSGTFVGNLKVLNVDGSTNFEINSSDAAANASFANGNVKITSAGAIVDTIAYSNYVPSDSVTNTASTIVPEYGTTDDIALFGSSTKNWLTTQEYVDRSIFQTTKRLNYLVGSDVSPIINKLDNYIKVLAEIDGSSTAAIIAGLNGNYELLNVTVDSIIGNSYNSLLINCVSSVWGDECPPQPIPDPVSQHFQEDGWFFSNIGTTNKINWYFPAFNNMKVDDIQNLFMNLFAVSTKEIPSLVVYTKPKNNVSDLFSGLVNASIVYKFGLPLASQSVKALKYYTMYTCFEPVNVYNSSVDKLEALASVTTNGTKSTLKNLTTQGASPFIDTYDRTVVSPDDLIACFGLVTSGLETIKDVMFILQSFNVTLKSGTTQMLFKNADVVNNYIMNHFFKKNSDFSTYLDLPAGYADNFINQTYEKNLIAGLPAPVTKPDVVETKISLFKVNNTDITSSSTTITLPATTTSSTQIPVKIMTANSPDKIQLFLNNVKVGDDVLSLLDRNITGLRVGDNEVKVLVVTAGNNVTTTRLVNLYVSSADASLKTILVNTISKDVANQTIRNNSVVNLPTGTANATIYVTPNASLVNSCKVAGGTTASTELVANGVVSPNGILINGLVTGDNTITITTKSEDLSSTNTTTFKLRVLSNDTSLSTFTIAGQNALSAATIELGSSFAGKTIGQLNIVRTSSASTTILSLVTLVGEDLTLQVGNNSITFTAAPQDGSIPTTYNRTLKVLSANAGLASVTINSVAKQTTTPNFILTPTTSLNVVAISVDNGKASVSVSGTPTTLTPGMSFTIIVRVQPEDQALTATDYSFSVYIVSNDADVDAVYINDNLITIAADNTASLILKALEPPSTFRFKAVESTTTSTLKYKMESDGQSVNIVSGATNNNIGITPGGTPNHLIITDTAEDGTSKDTTITITSLSTDISLSAFTATYGDTTNNVTSGQTITLATGVNEVVVAATSTYAGAEVTLDGVIGTGYSNKTISVPGGTTKEVLVNVKATDGTSTTNPYKVTFVAPKTAAQLAEEAQAAATALQTTATALQAAATSLQTTATTLQTTATTAQAAADAAAAADAEASRLEALINSSNYPSSTLLTSAEETATVAQIALNNAQTAFDVAGAEEKSNAQTVLTNAQTTLNTANAEVTRLENLINERNALITQLNAAQVIADSNDAYMLITTATAAQATATAAQATATAAQATATAAQATATAAQEAATAAQADQD